MVENVMERFNEDQVLILSPQVREKKGEYKSLFEDLIKDGFTV